MSKIDDCKQGYTEKSDIVEEFASTETAINKCNGCKHFTYDGEIVSCDYCNS